MSHFSSSALWVVCLCARWCGTCRDYTTGFQNLAAEFKEFQFVWLDVEDDAHTVDPVEVENFPTLLLAHGDKPVFFGPITPHLETLRRLIKAHQVSGQNAVLPDDELHQLLARIQSPST
jgi:thioredoxin 1